MALGISVYVTVIGLFLWSGATIAWAVWKNRTEPEDELAAMEGA
jgi:hypothetical protein